MKELLRAEWSLRAMLGPETQSGLPMGVGELESQESRKDRDA
jgi:hypothetical protein